MVIFPFDAVGSVAKFFDTVTVPINVVRLFNTLLLCLT